MKIIFQTSKPSVAIIENCKSKHELFFEKTFSKSLAFFMPVCYNNIVIDNGVIDMKGADNGK